ncbi:MAG: hypothetical protein U0228_24185 [Myxococcaceae bacterium]
MPTPSKPWFVRYEFTLPGKEPATFTVELDGKTLANLAPHPSSPPEWTKLEFQQCPNCPLKPKDAPHCPVALQLSHVVNEFASVFSYERVAVKVTVPERTYVVGDASVQKALSSLLGVYMVTAGCPVLNQLRPMVRLHLPFAGELETVARSTSMYLLKQYFVMKRGGKPDWSMEGLAETYRQTGQINRAFAERLRAATTKDANVNALIILHSFAQAVPDTIEEELEELEFLFRQ